MDDLLNMYSEEQLLTELGKGHYWYYDGRFLSNAENLRNIKATSVENAVYYRFYS